MILIGSALSYITFFIRKYNLVELKFRGGDHLDGTLHEINIPIFISMTPISRKWFPK